MKFILLSKTVKIMNKKIMSASMKFVSLILSAVMVFESSAPAYAQARRLPYEGGRQIMVFDGKKLLEEKMKMDMVIPADNTRVVRPKYIRPQILDNPIWQKAERIKMELLLGSKGSAKESEETSYEPLNYKQFYAEYEKAVNSQADKYKKDNESLKKQALLEMNMQAEKYLLSGEYSEADIAAWKTQETANIDKWLKEEQGKIEKIRTQELSKAKASFEEYTNEVNAAADLYNKEIFEEVQGKINELFTLYKNNPNLEKELRYTLFTTVPLFISMNYNGENLLNAEQEKIIFDFALDQLEKPITLQTDSANPYISALTVFAALGQVGDGGSTAVKRMVFSSVEAPQFHSYLLLTAVSALLAVKDYGAIRDILSYFNQQESIFETMDLLSVANWVDYFQTINGKYLGNMSSLAQYQLEDGTVANAYTDIALMLAEEGSPQALELLKNFGVDKCVMTLDFAFNLKDHFSPRCGGIKPFVAGALMSGKAGAERYTGPFVKKTVGQQEFTSDGRVRMVTSDEVNRVASAIDTNMSRFKAGQKESGMSANAFMALNLINEALGDIGVAQESFIDTAMLKQYKSEIANTMLGKGAIVDDARRASKEKGQTIYKYAKITGNILDVGILVWCAWDLAKLARGIYSLGRGAYAAFRLSRVGTSAQRMAYITSHLPHLRKYSSAAKSVAKFTARVKNGMEPVVLAQRALYTSAPLPKIAGVGYEGTAVAKTLATASFDAAKGGYVINAAEAYKSSAGQPGRVLDIVNTRKALDAGAASAQESFANRGFFEKYRGYRGYLSDATKEAFNAGKFDQYSLSAGIDFSNGIASARNVKWRAPVTSNNVNYLARPLGTSAMPGTLELHHRSAVGMDAEPLPVNVTIEKKIPTIKSNEVTNVLLTGEDDVMLSITKQQKLPFYYRWMSKAAESKLMPQSWSNGIERWVSNWRAEKEFKLVDPDFFKIGLDNESFANLAKMSYAGSTPLNLKFMGERTGFAGKVGGWFTNSFAGKKSLFPGTGTVFVREGELLRPTSIKLSTQKPFDGIQLIVNENNTISLLGKGASGTMTGLNVPFSLSLPKGELPNFLKYASNGNFNNPFNLSLTGAKNKLNTLFAVQFLSLSAASTSLVGPLRQNYPDISNTEVALISIVLPYASSFLSPFWAPFVKRYGSANMVKASLGLAGLSLTIPMFSGFHGFGDVNYMNPNKPSITPLLISGTLIGLSSSITRASFNPLMDKMGGGAGLLKGMAFKNLSSFAMLAPSLGAALWDAADPRYYTDADGNFLYNDKGEKILHSHTDFSLYNPLLLGITGGVFLAFQSARMPSQIGKVKGYTMSQFAKGLNGTNMFARGFNSVYRPVAGTLAETWNATKVLGKKGVWPIALASTAALGVESSLLYNYSQTESNRYTANYISNDAVKPVIATLALTIPPFLVRLESKPILKLFGGANNPETYKRLIGASLGSAAVGTALLATEDNLATFIPGMALVGMGFANTTNGLLKIGEYNLKAAKATSSMLTGYKVAYPGVHIGMAIFPKMFSGAADSQLEKDPTIEKYEALQDNIWIPALTLGGSAFFYGLGSGLFKFKSLPKPSLRIPTGLPAFARFGIGSPSVMMQDWRNNGLLLNNDFGQMNITTPSAELEDILSTDEAEAEEEIQSSDAAAAE